MLVLRPLAPPAALLAASMLFASACSTTPSDSPTVYGVPDAGSSRDAAPDSTANPSDSQPADTFGLDVGPVKDSELPQPKIVLYAHNDTSLYSIDPSDPKLPPTLIGGFDCVGGAGDPSMTDVAVDKTGKLYGVSEAALYLDMQPVAGGVVACAAGKVPIDPGTVGAEARFFGLTFAPPTPSLGPSETLIGANSNGDLYAIDTSTGKLTLVGNFGKVPADDGRGHAYAAANVGKNWELSGDIVFLDNKGQPVGFATLRDCPNPPSSTGCSRADTLVEIDVPALAPAGAGPAPIVTRSVRGQVLPAGCSNESCGFGSMYGIAALGDKVYGFSRQGDILTIDNNTGQGTLVGTPLKVPPSSEGFAGAGVTTLAPVIPPQPK
jgi:hypothetical protein